MLEKNYNPKDFEEKIYADWEESGDFKPDMRSDKDAFAVVIPPPNVTGVLHMGHALDDTLQDILIRYNRMLGKKVLWQPGMDHAGIATQMVVERNLAKEGITRHDLGREKFIETVWKWKEQSGGTICKQLRRLGASCDWSRSRFTMDEGLSRAVRKIFVNLYKDGLIYKAKKLVNWDSKFMTAVSDLEVVQKETVGKMYYYKYPIEGEEGQFIHIATTRPETMFGDTAVAVSKENEKLKHLIGKNCIIPIINRSIPIIADEHADPEKGTGAVKITPAHDFNDFEVGKRHNLPMINVLNLDATLNENTPYPGMTTMEARAKTIEALTEMGLMDKIEDHPMVIPYGDRSNVVIEPLMTDQWFVDAPVLAKEAIRVVEEGDMEFVPKSYEKTYFEWMRNIQPWCISRQLWWGHQMPIWYGPDGHIFCEENAEEAQAAADKFYGKHEELTRETDVLDTWFSSGLWAFSTLGWPEQTADLNYWYPTSVMVTGYDIIFFWVARMIFSGMEQMKKEPFKTVFIHGLVRDDKGRKMSKSLGNGIDPLEMAEKYGADALRFNLITGNSPGNDMRFFVEKCEAMRNFANKIWNASRFVMMNLSIDKVELPEKLELEDKWILSKLNTLIREVTDNLEAYELGVASAKIYDFIWDTYCDWYIELTKTRLNGEDAQAKQAAENVLCYVLLRILELLHPFMPFITEEIWQALPHEGRYLISAEWPEYQDALHFPEAEAAMEAVKDAISAIRARRAEMNVPPSRKAQVILVTAQPENYQLGAHFITRMAYASELTVLTAAPADLTGMVTVATHDATVYMPMAELVDIAKELERIAAERKKAEENLQRIEAKLANESFTSRAPENVVNAEREKAEKARALIAKLDDSAAAMKL